MEQNLLKFDHIYFSYHTMQGEFPVLSDVSFCVNKGEFVSLVGPSGCGKTTILNLFSGLLLPERGDIVSAQKDVGSTSFGYMLQQDQLFDWLTIWDNICLGLRIKNKLNNNTKKLAMHLMSKYGLEKYKNQKPRQLSGGMRQRASLIRTLVLEPDLLFLDEPFSALDYQNRLQAADDIGQIIKKENKTALLVTHDIGEAISLSSKIIILSSRPATVIKTIAIPFFHSGLSPLEIRNHSGFTNYFDMIWRELNEQRI